MKVQKTKISAEVETDTAIIRFLAPTLRDPAEAQKAAQEIENIAVTHNVNAVIINFSRLLQLSSVFLGRLVQLRKTLDTHGIQLRVCGMSADIEKAFKICKLDKAIPAFATEEDATAG